MLAFGHDHAGHGRSEGIQAYIETVDDYVDDLVDHCMVILYQHFYNILWFNKSIYISTHPITHT